MKFFITIILTLFTFLTNSSQTIDRFISKEYKSISINCDTIYKNKNYNLELKSINPIQERNNTAKYVFLITKILNEQTSEIIYKDTILSTTQEVLFIDFNNDGIKDILIQNTSSARSNQTYNLYLVDTIKDEIKKIKGFHKIPNPNYLAEYNLIDNYVLSGINWPSFYKIQSDSIIDYGIVIYDTQSDEGIFEAEYKRSIKEILENEKNRE